MQSKETVYQIMWENGRYDNSEVTELQELVAEKYFAKKEAMFYDPPAMKTSKPVLDHAYYMASGLGAISSTEA